MNNANKFIGKDLLWYFIGNICPIVIGIIKFPIYTRIFSPADFGAYSLVMLVFTYVSIVCYSWINSCAWRFYFQYKRNNKTKHLFSNLSLLFSIFTIVVLAGTLVYYYSSGNLLIKRLVIYCFLQYFTAELLSLLLIVPRLEGKSFLYNFIQAVKVIGSFGLLLLLTFYNGAGIEAFMTSNLILNTALLLVVIPQSVSKLQLSFNWINKQDLSVFFAYGKIGLFINICSTLLISSDRFLIEHYATLNEVGIYNQNYNIAQITISALISSYWSSLNPSILSGLEARSASFKAAVPSYFNTYFFCALPISFYAILYARQIADIMLGAKFSEGYSIIAWAALSEFIIGMYFIPSAKLKQDNHLKILSVYYLSALILNVGLNIIFIRQFGYKSSAIVTAIVYLLLLVCIYRHDAFDCFPQLVRAQKFRFCVAFIFLQIVIHLFSARFALPLYYYIIEAVIFATTYTFFAIKNKWISLTVD